MKDDIINEKSLNGNKTEAELEDNNFKMDKLILISPLRLNIDKLFKLEGYDTEVIRRNGNKLIIILNK